VLWRGGLRIQEALALGERDLDPRDLQDPPTGSSSTPSR
jgi:hypothetical protein